MSNPIATGFEFQLLPDGTVCIDFHDDDGQTINAQVVSGEVFARIPLAAFVALTATDWSAEVAEKLHRVMRAVAEVEDGSEQTAG